MCIFNISDCEFLCTQSGVRLFYMRKHWFLPTCPPLMVNSCSRGGDILGTATFTVISLLTTEAGYTCKSAAVVELCRKAIINCFPIVLSSQPTAKGNIVLQRIANWFSMASNGPVRALNNNMNRSIDLDICNNTFPMVAPLHRYDLALNISYFWSHRINMAGYSWKHYQGIYIKLNHG